MTNSAEKPPKKSLRLPIQLQSVTATKRGAVVTVLREGSVMSVCEDWDS
jgi:hypothetical protein